VNVGQALANTRHSMPEGASAATRLGHESSEAGAGHAARFIGWFAVGLLVLLIATAWVAFELLGGLRVPQPPAVTGPQAEAPDAAPPPALQSAPAGELRAYRRDKAALLQGYRWVDRSQGIVHIPIDQAMELTAGRSGPAVSAPDHGKGLP
jgi:hypothetical protein